MIVHVPGKENEQADALSRRDQDIPVGIDNQRITDRNVQLLKPKMLAKYLMVQATPVRTRRADLPRTIVEQSTDNVVGELPDKLVD